MGKMVKKIFDIDIEVYELFKEHIKKIEGSHYGKISYHINKALKKYATHTIKRPVNVLEDRLNAIQAILYLRGTPTDQNRLRRVTEKDIKDSVSIAWEISDRRSIKSRMIQFLNSSHIFKHKQFKKTFFVCRADDKNPTDFLGESLYLFPNDIYSISQRI